MSHESRKVGDEVRSGSCGARRAGDRGSCGCSQEQIDGFGDGEEEATRGRIGDGEGTTGRDLAGEDFRDAAAGGENIAEAEDCAARQ